MRACGVRRRSPLVITPRSCFRPPRNALLRSRWRWGSDCHRRRDHTELLGPDRAPCPTPGKRSPRSSIRYPGQRCGYQRPSAPIVAKSADNQPDLVVDGIDDAQQPFVDCQTPAGVKVTIRNAGTAWAGASTTRVSLLGDGGQSLETPMLAPGQTAIVFSTVQGIPSGDSYTAIADSTDAVAESDETNNTLVAFLSLGTLPTCTPTPEPTPTPTPLPPIGGIALDGEMRTLPLEDSATSPGVGSTVQWLAVTSLALLVLGGGVTLRRRRR